MCKVIKYPRYGFKIKSKADASLFLEQALVSYGEYIVPASSSLAWIIEKKRNGHFSAYSKHGDIYDPFNPMVEIATTETDRAKYNVTVVDVIYNIRKYINRELF